MSLPLVKSGATQMERHFMHEMMSVMPCIVLKFVMPVVILIK